MCGVVVTGWYLVLRVAPCHRLSASSPPAPRRACPARQPAPLLVHRGGLPSRRIRGSSSGHGLCHTAVTRPDARAVQELQGSSLPVPPLTPLPQRRACTYQRNTATRFHHPAVIWGSPHCILYKINMLSDHYLERLRRIKGGLLHLFF